NATTESGARVVNALLAELDGVKDRSGVYVIGTTNYPELIDEAILRPGRLGSQIFIDLPTPSERVEILQTIYRNHCKDHTPSELEAVAQVALGERCDNFSGADLGELRTKAVESVVARLQQDRNSSKRIVSADWEFALTNVRASVKNPDAYQLLNKYVGESERAVRDLFERARSSKPYIVFFGEMDSIVPPRANATTESGAGVVHALLAELDDTSNRSGIYVIGTTSHPELINEAFLRPDRLGQIFIDLPTPSERVEIPQAIYRTRYKHHTPSELGALAQVALDTRCTNFSRADLSELGNKAAQSVVARLRQDTGSPKKIVGVDGLEKRARSKRSLTARSDSPTYLFSSSGP
ncbi:hypothetical protein E4U56_007744, partial [Claviceps arundinis]